MKYFICLLLSTLLIGCASPPLSSAADDAQFRRAIQPVFEVDMPSTLKMLKAISLEQLSEKKQRARECVLERFAKPAQVTEQLPPIVMQILGTYRQYWHRVLLRESTLEVGNAKLADELRRLLVKTDTDLDALTEAAGARIESEGFFVGVGITFPLHELMIWSREETVQHNVELPFRTAKVEEKRLRDFVSLGWSAWGTCDQAHTGGWATKERLFSVADAWDFESEKYQSSLLKHESQHFSDYVDYPKMAQPDLEFRGKLTELATADKILGDLLEDFTISARRDRSLPHPFASYWVIEKMRARLKTEQWSSLTREQIRSAAKAELLAHSEALDKLGAKIAETSLPD
jgi:hypothetical protein